VNVLAAHLRYVGCNCKQELRSAVNDRLPFISSECVDAAVAEGPQQESAKQRSRNYSWAQLMKRVFAIDVLQCDRCGGLMRLMAAIHSPETTRKILERLGLPSRPPPMAPAVGEPALHFDQF
jgi:hypothetical protein